MLVIIVSTSEALAKGRGDVLITAEKFYYRFHTTIPLLKWSLDREGVRLKVLVVLRTQPDHIASAYGENMRQGHLVARLIHEGLFVMLAGVA